MSLLETALNDAGGTAAPRERGAQLRALLHDELVRSEAELALARSGREDPVTVVFAAAPDALLAVLPVPVAVRADPDAAPERAWLAVAAAAGALLQIAQLPPPRGADDLVLEAGALDGRLALRVAPAGQGGAELPAGAVGGAAAPPARPRAPAPPGPPP